MFYYVKTPWWLKKIYSSYTWHIKVDEKNLYLTFDDGPHPIATPFVLKQLKEYNAKATFFCLGKNVVSYPSLYKQILEEGHSVGNHTHNHLNGWKTKDHIYIKDVAEAAEHIESKLFRPPYGRITSFQANNLSFAMNVKIPYVVMWDILSGDFDQGKTPQQCASDVIKHSVPGSIIVFHDSEKAFPRLEYSLPVVLKYFSEKGYVFRQI